MVSKETPYFIPAPKIDRPNSGDWFSVLHKIPAALLDKTFIYGQDIKEPYKKSISSLLLIAYWQEITGVSARELEKSGAYDVLFYTKSLIREYDDFIDSNGSLSNNLTVPDLKNKQFSPAASQLTKAIYQLDVSRGQKQHLCQTICQFRRDQFALLHSQSTLNQDTLQFAEAANIREGTAGQIAFLIAEILDTPFDLSQDQKDLVVASFFHFCNVGQATDDIYDCQKDLGGNHPNMFLAALNENHEEKDRFAGWIKHKKRVFTVGQLRKIAPNSLRLVEDYVITQTKNIPNRHMQSAALCTYYFPKGIISGSR